MNDYKIAHKFPFDRITRSICHFKSKYIMLSPDLNTNLKNFSGIMQINIDWNVRAEIVQNLKGSYC